VAPFRAGRARPRVVGAPGGDGAQARSAAPAPAHAPAPARPRTPAAPAVAVAPSRAATAVMVGEASAPQPGDSRLEGSILLEVLWARRGESEADLGAPEAAVASTLASLRARGSLVQRGARRFMA